LKDIPVAYLLPMVLSLSILAGGVRMVIRSFYAVRVNRGADVYPLVNTTLTKVLIIGAGDAGEKILREIMENNTLHYEVVGFVDDDAEKQGRTIHGIRVLGTVERLPKIIKRKVFSKYLLRFLPPMAIKFGALWMLARNAIFLIKYCPVSAS
jgi:FlaA1/EpsC-like NDP-sugar epimerase